MTDVWDAHYATPAGHRFWPNEELVRWVAGRRFADVLEVGCGNGANLWFLAEQADRIVGIDNSDTAIAAAEEYTRRRHVRNLELYVGDARVWPWKDAEFDLIVDCMMSQHLSWAQHRPLYEQYRRVLKPGGRLFLYHLDCKTSCRLDGWLGGCDWSNVSLFPAVDLTCLPIPTMLSDVVELAGFSQPVVRGLLREYPNHDLAHYTILEAEVVRPS